MNADKVWLDGKLVPWNSAKVHVSAHAIHYGSSVFEGIRAYELPWGTAVFCLPQHIDRLWMSCRIYRMEIPFEKQELCHAVLSTIEANGHSQCYIRPVVFRGQGTFALDPRQCSTHVSIITVEMEEFLGAGALENGVDVGISSWRRMAPSTYPAAAKIGGQYVNSQFITMEAAEHGYHEGIALDINGYVSEGSGENIFLVRDGDLLTPPLAGSILQGITRQCVITLAKEMKLMVREEMISREMLYLADEVFFCGTAAEITPVRSVDGIQVSKGTPGPVTSRLVGAFRDILEGRTEDRHRWLMPLTGKQ